MKFNPEFIKLTDCDEFDKRFEFHYLTCKTYTEAYQLTEQDYRSVFGKTRYSSFESFKKTYNRRVFAK